MHRYRARQHAAGLRAATRWRPAAPATTSPGLLEHRIIEARSLAMHCLIARKIAADPGLLAAARRRLAAWAARYGDGAPRALEEWRAILDRPWPEIAAIGNLLRHSYHSLPSRQSFHWRRTAKARNTPRW